MTKTNRNKGNSKRVLAWRKRNPEKFKTYNREYLKKYYATVREKVLVLVGQGNLRCVRCGTDQMIEVNHKNGGGAQEHKRNGCFKFYRDIVKGRRSIEDLELLCRACNFLHLAEMLSGKKYVVKE